MRHLKKRMDAFWARRSRFELKAVWDILWEARRAFSQDGCMNLSAALAFYTILSLIPYLFLLVSAAGYLLGSSEEGHRIAVVFFDRVFPQASALILREVRAISHRAEVLGWVGFLSMIWTASVIFSSLEYAMGVVFRVEKRRNFLRSKLLALLMVPAFAGIFFLAFLVTAFSGATGKFDLSPPGVAVARSGLLEFLVGYVFPYLILGAAFTAVYKIIPNTSISFRHALAGGTSCAFLFEAAIHFLTWYFQRSQQYSVVYGSLAWIVILVVSAFYLSSVLLFCAEVVSAYRRRDITLLQKAFL
jgi:membrane protein